MLATFLLVADKLLTGLYFSKKIVYSQRQSLINNKIRKLICKYMYTMIY